MNTIEYKCKAYIRQTYQISGHLFNRKHVNVSLEFQKPEVSILRTLIIKDITSINIVNDIPKGIESLTIDRVPYSKHTAYMYDNLAELFPDLLYLSITNCNLNTLSALPKKLRTLVVSRNGLVTLPKLPDSLIYLAVNRNKLITLPKVLPKGLERLSIGCNFFESVQVITNDLDQLHVDYSPKIQLLGKVNTMTINKYHSGDMYIEKQVDKLYLSNLRLNAIHLPDKFTQIQVVPDNVELTTRDLSHLSTLTKFEGMRAHSTLILPKGTEFNIYA